MDRGDARVPAALAPHLVRDVGRGQDDGSYAVKGVDGLTATIAAHGSGPSRKFADGATLTKDCGGQGYQ